MDLSLDTLLMPFRFGFMLNAFYISLLVAVPTALLSCYLVMKGWALMGDAVSHAAMPSIVMCYILRWTLNIGASLAGMTWAPPPGPLSHTHPFQQSAVHSLILPKRSNSPKSFGL